MPMSFPNLPRLLTALVFAALLLAPICRGELTWDTQQIELTSKPGDKEAAGLYRFVNTGKSTVTITSVQPGCGCTTAELDKRVYAPGESGTVKAVFSLGDRVGQQEKIIYVATDDTLVNPVSLVLRVMIPELLTYAPRLLMWNEGGELGEQTTLISNNCKQPITTITIAKDADVVTRIEPVKAGASYQLIIRPVSTAKVMNVAVAGVATFADGTMQPFKVYALVR
jgi:hypothetical protein